MNALMQLLIACECLLRRVDETFWADKFLQIIQKNHTKLEHCSLEEIISFYGGMGSFNDLLISRYNGHKVAEEDEDEINDELDRIRDDIYRQAMLLLKKQPN